MFIHPFFYSGLAFLLAVGLTPAVCRIAIRKGWVAHPKKDRWHKKTTALMGGIAIFAAIAIPSFISADFSSFWKALIKTNGPHAQPSLAAILLVGAGFLFALGLFDDFKNIRPHTKLIGQILAAALVVFLGFRLRWFDSLTLDTMATLFWIVGITNAFNLIDNMDGLCAGVGLMASASLAFLYHSGEPEAFQLAVVFAGALAGFLIYNFNPAKIFMGDCGSLVIGFGMSVLTLFFAHSGPTSTLTAFAVPLLVLLVPLTDTTLVTVIRLLSGRKASTGGRDHTSHRLVLMGFSERGAVLLLYAVGGMSGLAAVFVSGSDNMTSPAVILPVVLAIFLMGVYLSQLRVYPEKEFSVLRGRSFTPVLLELTFKRQILLVLLDFILVAFAYYLSYRLRFEGPDFTYYFKSFLKSLPIIIGCKLAAFFVLGVYRGMWSFISTNDVFLYLRASLAGTLITIAAIAFIYRFKDFSKGIFVIDFVITTGLMLTVRGSFRLFLETQNRRTLAGDRIVIYGAGRAGELLLREILNNKSLHINPLGFIDDDGLKKGKKIQGFPILGNFSEIQVLHKKLRFDGIIIAYNNTNGKTGDGYACVKNFCRQNGIFLKRFTIDVQTVSLES